MKHERFIPLQVGRVKIRLHVEIIDPDDTKSADAKTAKRAGKGRLPEEVRKQIDELLIAGKKVAAVHEATGVSEPTIYLRRTILRREGKLMANSFNTMPARRGRAAALDEEPEPPEDELAALEGEDEQA